MVEEKADPSEGQNVDLDEQEAGAGAEELTPPGALARPPAPPTKEEPTPGRQFLDGQPLRERPTRSQVNAERTSAAAQGREPEA